MRPSRRLVSLLRPFVLVWFLVAAAQAAPAQSTPQLPPKWNDAAHALADKIAASVAPGGITFEVKNISSLNAGDASAIRNALKEELGRRHFHFAPGALGETHVEIILSEGADGFVWVAEVHQGDTLQVAIVGVPKSDDGPGYKPRESLSLDHRLIWTQPEKILDFAIVPSQAGPDSELVVLEPDRIAFYRSRDSEWHPWRSIPIPHSKPWPRDLRGSLDTVANKAELPGVQCSGNLSSPDEVVCVSEARQADRVNVAVPGHEGSEVATIFENCGGGLAVLASGTGDWTQPDSIQGYVLGDPQRPAMPSGDPIQLDGPVMSLELDGKEGAVRAVIHDLKAVNYEAFIVTATCSH
jgi:hypothetical protein